MKNVAKKSLHFVLKPLRITRMAYSNPNRFRYWLHKKIGVKFRPKAPDFPPMILLEPTNYCNFSCIHCPYKFISKRPRCKQGFMNFDLYKKIISKFVTLVNFHPSLLPSYREPIPSYWVIENKEKYTGITMHKVTEKIDNGEIIYNKFLSIIPGDTPEILDYKLSQISSEILEEHFFDIISNNLKNELEYDIQHLKNSYYGFIKK